MKEGIKVSAEQAAYIEAKTQGQSSSERWKSERELRLTASNFGQICTITERRDIPKLCEAMYSPKDLSKVPAIRHGNTYESIALEKFTESTGKEVIKSGFCVHPDFPFLGASPDGFVKDEDAIIEVKCPYAARKSKISPETVDFLEKVGDQICLKKTSKYYYQVIGQMVLSQRNHGYFVVYTHKDFFYQKMSVDNKFFTYNMLAKLKNFYNKHYCPYVASKLKE